MAAEASRPVKAITCGGHLDQTNRVLLRSAQRFSSTLRFSVIFLSCKANARVYDVKSGHGPHSPPQVRRLHLSARKKSLLRRSQSGLGTQTANQPKFIPPIISLRHICTSLCQTSQGTQRDFKIVSVSILPLSLRCLL